MRRTTMILVAAAGLAVTAGCAGSPQQLAGEAGPDGAATPAPTTSPADTPRPPVSSSPSSSPSVSQGSTTPRKSSKPAFKRVIGPANVLGPTGLGKLQIGMTRQAAEATGMVEAGEGDRDCGSWYLKRDGAGDSTVGWTSRGVVSIPAYGRIATPEGIRIGSDLPEVEKAYDDLTGVAADKDGGSWGDGPALAGQTDEYGGVHYRFLFVNGAVVELILEHDQRSC